MGHLGALSSLRTLLRCTGWVACAACVSPRAPHQDVEPSKPDMTIPPLGSARSVGPRLAPAFPRGEAIVQPNDIHDHPDLVGQKIVVDVFEDLWDADHSTGAEPGEYDVSVVDVGAWRFKITPGPSTQERAAGALSSLPVPLVPPVRVQGVARPTRFGVRLVAHRIELLSFPAPIRIPSTDVLAADPKAWSRKYVEVEDDWTVGFEASYLGDTGTWLDTYLSGTVTCAPPPSKDGFSPGKRRVRVTGFAYTAGGRYGHLGMANSSLVATSVIFLDPKRPECR